MDESPPLIHDGQLGNRQRQPLGTVARKVDVRPRIVARTFHCQHLALTKLGVEHRLAFDNAVAGHGLLYRYDRAGKDFWPLGRISAKLASSP